MAQTTVQRPDAVRFGSVKFEVGETIGTLVNIGALRNCQIAESWEELKVESGNAGILRQRVKNQKVAITADWLEWDLTTVNLLRGGIDDYGTVAAAPVNITDEPIVLPDTDFIRFLNKEGAGTECANIVVTTIVPGPTVRNTDYIIGVDPAGYTCIARIVGGLFGDGDTALVDYQYTPNVSKTLSTGGLYTINPRVVRLTNTNEAGETLVITIYYAKTEPGFTIPFPDDNTDDCMVVGISLVGDVDVSRVAGDQLYEIVDEQSVV